MGAGTALTPHSRCLVQLGLLPPPRNAPFFCSGCRRALGFDVPSPAPHPVRFYVTFRRFINLCPICACASPKPSSVSMATGSSSTPPPHLFLQIPSFSGLRWR